MKLFSSHREDSCARLSWLKINSFENIQEVNDPKQAAQLLRADRKRIEETYTCSKEMIAQSRKILERLKDPCLLRFVDATEARLDTYFRKDLKVPTPRTTVLETSYYNLSQNVILTEGGVLCPAKRRISDTESMRLSPAPIRRGSDMVFLR